MNGVELQVEVYQYMMFMNKTLKYHLHLQNAIDLLASMVPPPLPHIDNVFSLLLYILLIFRESTKKAYCVEW